MSEKTTPKKVAYTGLFAAIAASSCCIPPVIALIAGIGGSASALSWMEPFRPYLIGLAVIAIGYAWYNYFKLKNTNDCDCEIDEKPKWFQTKGFLIAITLFASVSIAFPYYTHIFYPNNKKEIGIVNESDVETIDFNITGMTCTGCEIHIESKVNTLDGIISVKADYEKATTVIKYDKTKVNEVDIERAILNTGYKINK